MVKVRQHFDRPAVADIPAEIRRRMAESGVLERVKSGDRVILRRAKHEARLLYAGGFDFFSRLRAKLEWGGR